jgi:hypothetical protein
VQNINVGQSVGKNVESSQGGCVLEKATIVGQGGYVLEKVSMWAREGACWKNI